MEFTWLADTPQSRSRTRAPKACPACQRRKRCRHLTADPEVNHYTNPRNSRGVASTQSPNSHIYSYNHGHLDHPRSYSIGPRLRANPARPTLSSAERFVGDLNPEAVIRERLNEPMGNPLRDRIGLWISSPNSAVAGAQREKGQAACTDAFSPSEVGTGALAFDDQTVASVLGQRYTSAMQACSALPTTTREPLISSYFSKINRIIPLVDGPTYQAHQNHGQTQRHGQGPGTASVFLERAICLVAAKDRAARPHLRLTETGPVMTPRQFCTEIYKGLVSAMDAELEPDRYTRIRVLALMSLHCEGYEGAEAASLHLCQAIHQAQTVGLHLDRPDRRSGDPLFQLFWCLWTLDKMHACIGGRPVLLADRDIGIEKPGLQMQASPGSFRVWLAVSDLLATIISFYRPSAGVTSGWEEGFPAFEDIVGETAHEDLDFATLGFLELYYHCAAILSCRYKLTETLDSTKVSSIRQGLAAVRIHSIVGTECAGSLPPLPIVPYAISLSMGVSYRQLRSSKLITHFDRAKASLEASCALLEGLGAEWYSAEAMARLGRKALQQIEHEHPRQPAPETLLARPAGTTGAARSLGPADAAVLSGAAGAAGAMAIEVKDPALGSVAAGPETAMGSPLASENVNDLDSTMHGFADIDTLFGEFLDLSLPTNFWDPLFAEGEPTDGGQ
ncbi:uncharacterized protein N7482_010207 [Penicillium canariense]|uniref:Xylanolytic transcriptional activator regulatory domain-containing protein n=1 Tax=Penicillium canariense TaxID=189055 RepID=A0A9W9HLJ9_9EURO|nr:uncharacterized protein N7482_010207 [Penicillium canariense]KAJ5150955.1 hypothetical protein N7482_010207 [Penicillium canariense]